MSGCIATSYPGYYLRSPPAAEIFPQQGVSEGNTLGKRLDALMAGMPEVAEGKGCNWLTRGLTP